MDFNTTPLFGRERSKFSNDSERELRIFPDKPLDLDNNSSAFLSVDSVSGGYKCNEVYNLLPSTNTDNKRETLAPSVSIITQSSPLETTANIKKILPLGNIDIEATPIVESYDKGSVVGNPYNVSFSSNDDQLDNIYMPENDLNLKGLGITTRPLDLQKKQISNVSTSADRRVINLDNMLEQSSPPKSINLSILNSPYVSRDSVQLSSSTTSISYQKFPGRVLTHMERQILNDPTSTNQTVQESCAVDYDGSGHNTNLNIDTESISEIRCKVVPKENLDLHLDDKNLAYLFIIAVHSFDSKSLKSEEDISICLSFEKDDIAFVHVVDRSGWGEVTLIKNGQRGWIPFNYFSDVINNKQINQEMDPLTYKIESRKSLEKLLSWSAKFLIHPQDSRLSNELGLTFNVEYINGIRDGVKYLLEHTDSVSRSNELVKSKPMVRKARKKLLAEWYSLMIKADSYKNTTDGNKIVTLKNLIFQLLVKAFAFYNMWAIDKREFELEQKARADSAKALEDPSSLLNNTMIPPIYGKLDAPYFKIEYLSEPPSASSRLNEIHQLLFTYNGLILGRLDMIEHNSSGCEVLEFMVHQIILLLRELLYINKSCSSIINSKYKNTCHDPLDDTIDTLLGLVSELVSCVKAFVTQTINENYEENYNYLAIKDELYNYTRKGEQLITIISKMIKLIGIAISGCNGYLRVTGDFKLGSERKYPNFQISKLVPEQFFTKCSYGLIAMLEGSRSFADLINETYGPGSLPSHSKNLVRFSSIRSGENGFSFTPNGIRFLQRFLPINNFFPKESRSEDTNEKVNIYNSINNKKAVLDETIYDKNGDLIGASFQALVFMATDEMNKPKEFFVSTFLLNFKFFATSFDLVEALITRFDINDTSFDYESGDSNGKYSSRTSRMKHRRKMVCSVLQVWLESFWDHKKDYQVLVTIINFLNECVSILLPLEGRNLIDIASSLAIFTPNTQKNRIDRNVQLVQRHLFCSSNFSLISPEGLPSSNRSSLAAVDEQMIEEYELTKLPGGNSSSISLPIPLLNLGISSLLTKRNLNDLERLVKYYRDISGSPSLGSDGGLSIGNLEELINQWNMLVKSSYTQEIPINLIHNDTGITDLNPLEVAKQLSLIESKMFLSTNPWEIINEYFLQRKLDKTHINSMNTILNFTNFLSRYVLESILDSNLSWKKRMARLKVWLKVALSALFFRNFNTVASIMTALQSHIISRLKKLWDSLKDKDLNLFEYLSKIVHPNNNYGVYRKKLKKIVEYHNNSDSNMTTSILPTVPFFNLFLQDITFIIEGNTDFRNTDSFKHSKIINIDKYFKITRNLSWIQFFQVGYDIDGKNNTTTMRDSFFHLNGNVNVDSKHIKSVPLLQEFILYEFWRVNFLYLNDNDRGYKLSLGLQPKQTQS